MLKHGTVVLARDAHQGLHRNLILGGLKPGEDLLTHLRLVGAVANRAGVLERLASGWSSKHGIARPY